MKKKQIILGSCGKNQRKNTDGFRVLGRRQRNTPFSTKTHTRPYDIVIVGGIGDNERVNRDSKRVLDRQGCMYSLKAHISFEPPLVIRRVTNGDVERH